MLKNNKSSLMALGLASILAMSEQKVVKEIEKESVQDDKHPFENDERFVYEFVLLEQHLYGEGIKSIPNILNKRLCDLTDDELYEFIPRIIEIGKENMSKSKNLKSFEKNININGNKLLVKVCSLNSKNAEKKLVAKISFVREQLKLLKNV